MAVNSSFSVADQVDRRRRDVDARRLRGHDDLVERDARSTRTSAIDRSTVREIDAQADGQVRLRVHVDAQDAVSLLGQRAAEIDGGRSSCRRRPSGWRWR